MYNGGKNGSGVYQAIINEIPPHLRYIELFLGSGAIMRRKKQVDVFSIGIDPDESILEKFNFPKSMTYYPYKYDEYLDNYAKYHINDDTFIYADPPYLLETRTSKKKLYKYEFFERFKHEKLLQYLRQLDCMIMISHYENDLYNRELWDWRKVFFNTVDRSGKVRSECLYCNYPPPVELHDYRYLGKDNTDRQRIRRKINRHVNKLNALPTLERNAIIDALRSSIDKSTCARSQR